MMYHSTSTHPAYPQRWSSRRPPTGRMGNSTEPFTPSFPLSQQFSPELNEVYSNWTHLNELNSHPPPSSFAFLPDRRGMGMEHEPRGKFFPTRNNSSGMDTLGSTTLLRNELSYCNAVRQYEMEKKREMLHDSMRTSRYTKNYPDGLNYVRSFPSSGALASASTTSLLTPPSTHGSSSIDNFYADRSLSELEHLKRMLPIDKELYNLLVQQLAANYTQTSDMLHSTMSNDNQYVFYEPEIVHKSVSQCSQRSSQPRIFSNKVFVGGICPDMNKDIIEQFFSKFGNVFFDWPTKTIMRQSGTRSTSYLFLVYPDEVSVRKLISCCFTVNGGQFVKVPKYDMFPIQVRPWRMRDSVFVAKDVGLDTKIIDIHRTVFVGGLPRIVTAGTIANVFSRFGKILLVNIDVDQDYGYPKGAARVTFATDSSLKDSLNTRYLKLDDVDSNKTTIEIKPYVMEDVPCDECGGLWFNPVVAVIDGLLDIKQRREDALKEAKVLADSNETANGKTTDHEKNLDMNIVGKMISMYYKDSGSAEENIVRMFAGINENQKNAVDKQVDECRTPNKTYTDVWNTGIFTPNSSPSKSLVKDQNKMFEKRIGPLSNSAVKSEPEKTPSKSPSTMADMLDEKTPAELIVQLAKELNIGQGEVRNPQFKPDVGHQLRKPHGQQHSSKHNLLDNSLHQFYQQVTGEPPSIRDRSVYCPDPNCRQYYCSSCFHARHKSSQLSGTQHCFFNIKNEQKRTRKDKPMYLVQHA